jgi:hypothetical protein
MKKFHATRKAQIGSVISLLLIAALFSFTMYMFFRLDDTLDGVFDGATSSFPWTIVMKAILRLWPMTLGMFLLVIWMGISTLAVRNAQLIFEEDELILRSLDRPLFLLQRGLKPFEIPYNQIANVKTNVEMSRIDIFDRVGRHYAFHPALFGAKNGENVLLELQQHVPSEVFESGQGFPRMMEKWSRAYIRSIFIIAFSAAYLLTFFLDPSFSSRSWFVDAWRVERRPWGYENVRTFSLDHDNNFWITAWKSDGYLIYKFPDDAGSDWKLRESLLEEYDYPELVSANHAGAPIVWMNDRAVHYQNGTWQSIPYQDNLDVDYWQFRGVVSGEQGWIIDEEGADNRLLKINALSGDWDVLLPPATAEQENLLLQSMKQTVNGEILVLAESDTNGRVYLLTEDIWETREYAFLLPNGGRSIDYFLDKDNSLWVLFSSRKEPIVQKISSAGTIQVTHIPVSGEMKKREWYSSIVVDSSERLWISGSYPAFVAVFTPVWDGDSTEIVRYTEKNSNYKSEVSTEPVLLPDGKIWSFGRMISSIDSNLKVLPAPLPNWFASLDLNIMRLVILMGQLIYIVVGSIVSHRRMRS